MGIIEGPRIAGKVENHVVRVLVPESLAFYKKYL